MYMETWIYYEHSRLSSFWGILVVKSDANVILSFTHVTSNSFQEHVIKCTFIEIELEFGVLVFVYEGKSKNLEKTPFGA